MRLKIKHTYHEEAPAPEAPAPAAAPAPEAAPADFRTGLPEDLRANPSLQDFKDVGGLAKSYVELKQYQGASVRVPGEDAGDSSWAEFYAKLNSTAKGKIMPAPTPGDEVAEAAFREAIGIPTDPAQYDIPQVEGVNLPQDRVDFLREVGIKAGIPKKALAAAAQMLMERDKATMEGQVAQIAEGHKGLQGEWGAAYDQRLGVALAMAQEAGAPEWVKQAAAGNALDADTAKWLYSMAERLNDDERLATSPSGESGFLSPAEAQAQIDEIMANPKHPYNVKGHPSFEQAREKVRALHILVKGG